MITALVFFLAILSTASLTASLLLWFVLAPKALATLIDAKTQRVVVPGEVFDAIAGRDEFQLSSDELESGSVRPKNKTSSTPTYEDFDV